MSPADDAATVWSLVLGLGVGGALLGTATQLGMFWWFPGTDDEDDENVDDDGNEW